MDDYFMDDFLGLSGRIYTGTTPSFTFNLAPDFNFYLIKKLEIAFENHGKNNTILKSASDCTIDNDAHTITVMLTREDANALSDNDIIETQLRIVTDSQPETIVSTEIFRIKVEKAVEDGDITK